ncbi:hypothetical protein CHS0354_029480 [Potamilus streckersoni]|uniref:MAM domain-containing protein n=1 Tax=Potamilus streckersoni TaxID=2493646 RepID=A0AAE0S7E3_9BIVA|nr:hypothetical protein CHS0354_029480 [Potamilus streckersoni]
MLHNPFRSCTYAYLSPLKETGKAELWRIIRKSSAPRCLHIWSTGLPQLNGLLNVSVIGCENQTNSVDSRLVRSFNTNWTRTSIDIAESDHQLIIEGIAHNDGNAYLAIDDIYLQNGKCTDCSFDANLCNWANNGTSEWTVLTAGSRTCAVAQGNGQAILVSPLIYSGNTSRSLCLIFTYTISGSDANTLNISAKPKNQSLWMATTAADGVWRTDVLDVQENDTFQVQFQSSVVLGYIGVDDVAIYLDGCKEVKGLDNDNKDDIFSHRRAKKTNHTENNKEHAPPVQTEISQHAQNEVNQISTSSCHLETSSLHRSETIVINSSQASSVNAIPSDKRKHYLRDGGQKYGHVYDPEEVSFGYNPPYTHTILRWIAASELNGQSVVGDVPYDYILDGHTRHNVSDPNYDHPDSGRTSVEINPVIRVTDMAHYNLADDGNLYANNPEGNYESNLGKQESNEATIQIGSDGHYLTRGCMYTSVKQAQRAREKLK